MQHTFLLFNQTGIKRFGLPLPSPHGVVFRPAPSTTGVSCTHLIDADLGYFRRGGPAVAPGNGTQQVWLQFPSDVVTLQPKKGNGAR